MIQVNTQETKPKFKLNYKKYFLIVLLFILLIFIHTTALFKNNLNNIYPVLPTNNSTETILPNPNNYPSEAFWLSKGEVTVNSDNIYQDFFTLTLHPKPLGAKTFDDVVYNIPVSNSFSLDYIEDPKISHQENYGCVLVGSSGYSGYYIFKLPDGEKIDQGKQYSQCIEWIDDNQVIIAENLYNTREFTYYIFDAKNKTKKIISRFSNK